MLFVMIGYPFPTSAEESCIFPINQGIGIFSALENSRDILGLI